MPFVELEPAEPERGLGPELGVFDSLGQLAASYRRYRKVVHTWVFDRSDAGINRFLILDSEARARAFCEQVAEERSSKLPTPVPDLDAMLRDLSQQ